MEEEKGWIEEGRLYDSRRKRIKKTLRRGRIEMEDQKDMEDEEERIPRVILWNLIPF